MKEKGVPINEEFSKQKKIFVLIPFLFYNFGVSLFVPQIWKMWVFSCFIYLETTCMINYFYCQTLINTDDIFLCGLMFFWLYHMRWMLTQTFVLTVESERSLSQLTSIFDQLPDAVLLLKKASEDHQNQLKLNHLDVLEDNFSMGD